MKTLEKHKDQVIEAQTEHINWLLKSNDTLKEENRKQREENRDLRFKCGLLYTRLGAVYKLYHKVVK